MALGSSTFLTCYQPARAGVPPSPEEETAGQEGQSNLTKDSQLESGEARTRLRSVLVRDFCFVGWFCFNCFHPKEMDRLLLFVGGKLAAPKALPCPSSDRFRCLFCLLAAKRPLASI